MTDDVNAPRATDDEQYAVACLLANLTLKIELIAAIPPKKKYKCYVISARNFPETKQQVTDDQIEQCPSDVYG